MNKYTKAIQWFIKYGKEDFKKFSFFQKFLVILDMILNPSINNYPFGKIDKDTPSKEYERENNAIIVHRFDGGKQDNFYCIRWI